jgi:hypothetical protein
MWAHVVAKVLAGDGSSSTARRALARCQEEAHTVDEEG